MQKVDVFRLQMSFPADMSNLEKMVDSGEIAAESIQAIIAQTEGDGFARGYALQAFERLLSERLGIPPGQIGNRIPLMMIGMTGGLMVPHMNVLTKVDVTEDTEGGKRLALGVSMTREFLPEEYGTMVHVEAVSAAVKEAMRIAGLEDASDVHCVEIKCPMLTPARIEDATRRKKTLVTSNITQSGSYSRGASALGVALALGEVAATDLSDDVICRNWNLYSNVASTSSGGEQTACKVVVLGNSTASASELVIGHSVMKDGLDLEGAKAAFRNAGLTFECCPGSGELKRVACVFVNSGTNGLPTIRGKRHTMLSDYLWSFSGTIAKAVSNAVVGAILGDSMFLNSAGYEHQGPPGSNLVAVIARA
ncbi:MAG: ring-opening amidohydrolase [Deltaproteobacteria bacterium]|nr:ring-opening amidohydrolase [Deltaproteobacteria bacterium]